MVDGTPILPQDERPLRILFLDLNAYFASVEQQEDAALRGRPVGVCPVMADSSFIIAASYEAKRCGVKTGTQICEARRMCPDIALVPAHPSMYVAYHQRVLSAVDTVLPIEKVCSIDEMRCRLIGAEQEPENAKALARRVKRAIQDNVGERMTCSVGLAPNSFLAKLATDLQKPDGLIALESKDLPDRIRGLSLTEFCGINRRMQARLQAHGLFSSDDLLDAGPERLRLAFGSVIGERWWYLLRGYDLPEHENDRQSLSHSHVLPPELRTDEGCREVLLRLAHKAAARLRKEGFCARHMHVSVSGFSKSWRASAALPPTQDTVTITQALLRLWGTRDFVRPRTVGVAFTDVAPRHMVTPSLFETTEQGDHLSHAIDQVNMKFGKNKVWLAAMQRGKDAASEKIAFHKVDLFQEGKGDNEWPNAFRGVG